MDLKVVLNRCHPISRFVYGKSAFRGKSMIAEVRPRRGSKVLCSRCERPGPCYDTARVARRFEFVPLWGYKVFLEYCMRRVWCAHCAAVVVERVPWAEGKQQACDAYRLFLARWAKRLSWSEVATIFGTSFGVVHRAIAWVVAYGLAKRSLDGVRSIGVDEIAPWTGQKYLTVVYQLDEGVRRLLWVGQERTRESFARFFDLFGEARSKALEYVASDMWRPYLEVIRRRAAQALHVLDRFHLVAKLNQAVDKVRAAEVKSLARQGYQPILTHSRWCLLKKPANLSAEQTFKLADLLRYDLRTVRAYLHKAALDGLWKYRSVHWAGRYLDQWCSRVMRSRLEPMKKIARSLRHHRPLILNWFRAKGELSAAVVEGLNLNAKLAIRKARGFRTYEALETALYHQLGHLPEPELAHEFC